MDNAVLNSEFIATKAGIIMMVKHENIFPHQLNFLQLVSVSRHVLV